MKSNKGLLIAVIAGVAVAGVVGFLFGTEIGKDIRKKIQKNQGKIFNQANEVYSGVKEKISGLKDDMVKEGKRTEKFSEKLHDI